jgi:hypothetical protein
MRMNQPLSDSDQLTQSLLLSLVRSVDPNALDKVVSSRNETDGSSLTRVNATNENFYIYFSLSTNKQVPASSAGGTGWDIAFNRYKLASNSGATNTNGRGGICLSNLTNFNQASVTSSANQNCPDSAFVIDGNSTTQGIGGVSGTFIGNPLLTDWFSYQIGNLTAKNQVFIVRSGDGLSFFTFRMENYYSDAGTSGYPLFRWRKIP